MKTNDLNIIPNVKGVKNGQNSADQVNAAVKRENASEGKSRKTVYLIPTGDNSLNVDKWYKYNCQQMELSNSLRALKKSVIDIYANQIGLGVTFALDLFMDACCFTSAFTCDIVTKVEPNQENTDISYIKGGVTINRYLVEVDGPNVCSVFRHFVDYARATNRPSVAMLQHKEKLERTASRRVKSAEKKEQKEVERVGTKIQEMDVTKLLSLLTPEQLAAIAALQAAK